MFKVEYVTPATEASHEEVLPHPHSAEVHTPGEGHITKSTNSDVHVTDDALSGGPVKELDVDTDAKVAMEDLFEDLAAIESLTPDLAFLDRQMAMVDSFEQFGMDKGLVSFGQKTELFGSTALAKLSLESLDDATVAETALEGLKEAVAGATSGMVEKLKGLSSRSSEKLSSKYNTLKEKASGIKELTTSTVKTHPYAAVAAAVAATAALVGGGAVLMNAIRSGKDLKPAMLEFQKNKSKCMALVATAKTTASGVPAKLGLTVEKIKNIVSVIGTILQKIGSVTKTVLADVPKAIVKGEKEAGSSRGQIIAGVAAYYTTVASAVTLVIMMATGWVVLAKKIEKGMDKVAGKAVDAVVNKVKSLKLRDGEDENGRIKGEDGYIEPKGSTEALKEIVLLVAGADIDADMIGKLAAAKEAGTFKDTALESFDMVDGLEMDADFYAAVETLRSELA